MRSTLFPPRVGLHHSGRSWPAIPLSLRGDRADLLFREVPPACGAVRLVLDWADGTVTELGARMRRIDENASVVRFDVNRVAGDWARFAAFLGEDEA